VQTRRRKKRARKDLAVAVKREKKLSNQNEKKPGVNAPKSG
jgi:hypothetical protein